MKKSITIKDTVGFVLLLLLAGVFIFSAISKLVSIEPFEWTFMDLGFSNSLSYFFARFLIGFELLLAFFLIAHLYLKKLTYPVIQLFLFIMTIYLGVILYTKGNDIDCGCFGDSLPMTPLVSIAKNIGLMLLTFILSKTYTPTKYPYSLLVATVGTIATFIFPFYYVPFSQKPQPIDLNALYINAEFKAPVDIRVGKHLVAFMSLGCPHCRNAARIFKDMYAKDSTLPILMVLNGSISDTSEFFQDTKSFQVPHVILNNKDAFIKMAGPYVPQIYWINNSVRERKLNYAQLSTGLLKNWNEK